MKYSKLRKAISQCIIIFSFFIGKFTSKNKKTSSDRVKDSSNYFRVNVYVLQLVLSPYISFKLKSEQGKWFKVNDQLDLIAVNHKILYV
jgi:hypothetical protein